ncbi:hypothetical protein JCM8547_003308 [Rhodosporidiobolus lusitaniae]
MERSPVDPPDYAPSSSLPWDEPDEPMEVEEEGNHAEPRVLPPRRLFPAFSSSSPSSSRRPPPPSKPLKRRKYTPILSQPVRLHLASISPSTTAEGIREFFKREAGTEVFDVVLCTRYEPAYAFLTLPSPSSASLAVPVLRDSLLDGRKVKLNRRHEAKDENESTLPRVLIQGLPGGDGGEGGFGREEVEELVREVVGGEGMLRAGEGAGRREVPTGPSFSSSSKAPEWKRARQTFSTSLLRITKEGAGEGGDWSFRIPSGRRYDADEAVRRLRAVFREYQEERRDGGGGGVKVSWDWGEWEGVRLVAERRGRRESNAGGGGGGGRNGRFVPLSSSSFWSSPSVSAAAAHAGGPRLCHPPPPPPRHHGPFPSSSSSSSAYPSFSSHPTRSRPPPPAQPRSYPPPANAPSGSSSSSSRKPQEPFYFSSRPSLPSLPPAPPPPAPYYPRSFPPSLAPAHSSSSLQPFGAPTLAQELGYEPSAPGLRGGGGWSKGSRDGWAEVEREEAGGRREGAWER